MALLREIKFAVEGKIAKVSYDPDQLKLGAIVYVQFSHEGEPVEFSAKPFDEAAEYGIRWIAPSEWYVELVAGFKLRPEFAQRVQDEIGEYITRADIDIALNHFSRQVRADRFYRTSELGDNPLNIVFTVLERLADCRRLRKNPPYSALVAPYLEDPLVSYLYLTCFDRIGQPATWLDFGAWLESSDSEGERDIIIQESSQATNPNERIKMVYRRYTDLYGVKSSFFRFLHEILPKEVRRELLESVEQTIISNPPTLASTEATDEQKEKYLFKRRNDYTHKAGFRPPAGEWFGRSIASPVQEFFANYWTSTRTHGWPDMLEKAVRAGLASYLLANKSGITL